ncbi:hypothetical protein ECEC1846_3838 [Escherichia coli EC1846]|uniref:Uncharacterized protein n=3 Tax=Escherichia coli TaxID=562 RepID=A0A0H3PMU1_ECO5C|nr:hypothetical protein ECH74115_3949 [Escherichia coli O157:H7 str. EC4115]AIG70023.1 hypothetical protein EDL933_3866 [Escherichia coli O157:H7 str. EDL933]AJA27656.1 hypothetical protein SS52_3830 [Escherichia coli O157:H7 str. SS52]EDU33479.1 hypothetical protein ECH7EC4196_1335 [Escherichia coli O157:H7 str. EC4196]EDU53911.1 hypothetical protein ECH7EC4113_0238 [Escherichia coli O157:H7 str. EC4113]EDU72350.1 hypothetical protein ECH7EC4076_2895 [Escherichia coli O157:H7 str. EC4076]EDU
MVSIIVLSFRIYCFITKRQPNLIRLKDLKCYFDRKMKDKYFNLKV